MLSPQLFHVVTALAFLLVICHGDVHQKAPEVQAKPGPNSAPAKNGKPVMTEVPQQKGLPASSGKLMPSGPHGLKGEQDKKEERRPTEPAARPAFLDAELQKTLKGIRHQITRLEEALALNGIITTFENKIFTTNGQHADFQTARETCKQAGGSIASPSNKGENDAVFGIVKSFKKGAFLGIKGAETPGEFHFLDGTAMNYTHWGPAVEQREKMVKQGENCVKMCITGAWNNTICNQPHLTICEF